MLAILIITVILVALVQTPYVQNIIRAKAEKYLAGKLNTRVEIGGLRIGFPHTVLLTGVFLADKRQDTLLSAGLIHIEMNMWGLLHRHVDVTELQLADMVLHVSRQLPDTVFNFQFIPDAFAAKEPAAPGPKTGSPMRFSMDAIRLDHVRLFYNDTVTGNDDELRIAHSLTKWDEFDPSTGHFSIRYFFMQGGQAKVWQGQPLVQRLPQPPASPVSAAGRPSSSFRLNLREVGLEEFRIDYRNSMTSMVAGLEVGSIAAEFKTFDLGNLAFAANSLRIDNTNVRYDNNTQPHQRSGMDYAHLDVRQFTLHASDLQYAGDSVSGRIAEGHLKEAGSGFTLDKLQASFLYSDHQAFLKDLDLRTPGTVLQNAVAIRYSSVGAIADDPAHTLIEVDLRDSHVRIGDILHFVPSLRTQAAFRRPAETWQLNARMKGSLAALRVETLQFSGMQDIKLDAGGIVRNLTDPNRMDVDMDIRNLSGSRNSLAALLPPNTLPADIGIPGYFSLRGKLRGNRDSVRSDIALNTSSGNLTVKGVFRGLRNSGQATYNASVQTDRLDMGSILRNKQLWGPVTADFSIVGRGFDPHSAVAKLKGILRAATVNQFDYRDFRFDASLADQRLDLNSSIDNDQVRFDLRASVNLAGKYPAIRLEWHIDTLDLYAIHLVKESLQFHGRLTADFISTDPDSLQGSLKLFDLALHTARQALKTDSILLVAQRSAGLEDIRLSSEMADIDLRGRYKISEIGPSILQTIDRYYHLSSTPAPRAGSFAPQDWQMTMHLRASPLLLSMVPSLKGTDSIGGKISFNSDRGDLRIAFNAPRIQLGTQVFNQVGLQASTNDQTGPGKALTYDLELAGAHGAGFVIYRSSLRGRVTNNQLFTSLLLKDEKGRDRHRLAGELTRTGDAEKFALNPDSLLLNYERWTVSRDNYILYAPAGIVINDLKISNKVESLLINSHPPVAASPIDLTFVNFRLGTISRFAQQDSSMVDGLLNGKAEVKNVLSTPLFTADLRIKGLTIRRDTVGDLIVKVNNEKANAYSADISLQGFRNDVRIKGDYYSGESRMDLKLDLNRLNLASIRPFLLSQIQDMKGSLKGSLALSGNFDKPGVSGSLFFDSALIVPLITGEPLRLSNDKIEFDADGFNFSEFTLQDSSGNKATIDGNVYTKDYKDFESDVTLNAHNFRLVNAAEASNRLFYGKLNIDVAVNITGDPVDALSVDGNLRVNKNTDFVFVLPQNNPEVVDREGVVRFVDHTHPGDTLTDMAAILLASRNAELKGYDVSLGIETDSSALLTMIMDERNGDALSTRGRSSLVFGMDKSGKTDLTGAYEIESGSYNLSLNLLKRKFLIQRGSTITWTGDPNSATLNITAAYTANTPSIDLIENEIAGRPQDQINKFKQKLPFLVTLKMEGDLLKPDITFDITLPTDILTLWPDVDLKLQQIRAEQSELNKQVFALLLLNRFVGQNPLQSTAGGGISVSNIAFQSASQILTNQLDQLAASLIKGVDVHFDLNKQQDFSTGTEQDYTELNVGLSKQLFDERVEVSVGSNFDVQGAGNPNRNASNIAGDAAVDYKLTRDGRYRIRAYRKNQYEAVVEGEVVETGVSFILTFDYDRFREIFGRTKEEKLQDRIRARSMPENATPAPAKGTSLPGTSSPVAPAPVAPPPKNDLPSTQPAGNGTN
ncbi:MAG: translocation/assembly module TamB domain-containing protein [Bacteroidota bacterium]|nr:translocation/assembly module TamB domain-containing protein [Bacteroidota bacterium]